MIFYELLFVLADYANFADFKTSLSFRRNLNCLQRFLRNDKLSIYLPFNIFPLSILGKGCLDDKTHSRD